MKRFLKYFLLFFIPFLIFFYISIGRPIYCDEIWGYGFSHNLSKGMLIYRDFNVLQMPLYFFISSFFIKIFGDYVISIHIFDCILIGFLFLLSYKKYGYKSLLILFLLFVGFDGYNLFSLFLILLILYFIRDNEYNDFLIGILVGLIFITKQNVGLSLFIPYIYYSKSKVKSIIIFLLPFFFVCVFFLLNSSIVSFLDCVFGSMFDFNQHNKMFVPFFMITEVLVVIHLIVMAFQKRFKDKRILYVLFFQVMSYPIFDDGHVFLSLIPYFYLLFDYSFTFSKFLFLIVLLGYSFLFFPYSLENIHLTRDVFWLRNDNNIDFSLLNSIHDKEEDYDYIFIADWYAYVYKLYYNIPINQYDFLLSGNAGYHGVQKRINEIDQLCKEKSCLFAIRDNEFQQWFEFDYYIKDSYQYIEEESGFKFYRGR